MNNSNQKEEYVYLARIFTESDSKRMEALLRGENPQRIGSAPLDNSLVLSDFVDQFDPSKAKDKVEAFKWLENYKKMQQVRSYYMMGDSAEAIANSINILAFQPNTEKAHAAISNGEMGTMEDYFAYDRPTMAVIKLPLSELERLLTQGYAERRVGDYGTDFEKQQLEELTLGDDAIRQIFQNKQIALFGETHDVMKKLSSMDFDPNNILKYQYKPSITIGFKNHTNNSNQTSNNSSSLTADDQAFYLALVDIMARPKDEKDFMLEELQQILDAKSFQRIMDYYNSNNPDMEM